MNFSDIHLSEASDIQLAVGISSSESGNSGTEPLKFFDQILGRLRGYKKLFGESYHLVMTNILLWKITILIGKSTISMVIFTSYV